MRGLAIAFLPMKASSRIFTQKKLRDHLLCLRSRIQKTQGFSESDRRGITWKDTTKIDAVGGSYWGSFFGGLFGTLMGAGLLFIPGTGAVLVAGPIAGVMAGWLAGTVVGGSGAAVAGGLAGAL